MDIFKFIDETNIFFKIVQFKKKMYTYTLLSFVLGQKMEYATFGLSCRGTATLLYRGYKFLRDCKYMDSTNWRCAYYHRFRCKARAITSTLENGRIVVTCRNNKHTELCVPFPTPRRSHL